MAARRDDDVTWETKQPRSERRRLHAGLRFRTVAHGRRPAGSMDAAEYKHVVLGLIFLKYISDAFEEARAKLEAEVAQGADPEDPDEYRAQSIFWVPSEARWPKLQAQARQPSIGQAVDDAILVTMTDLSKQADTLGYPPLFRHPQMDSAFFTTNDSARSSS